MTQNNQQPGSADEVVEAARRLIKAKGRYHTEQNYKALAAALDNLAAPSPQVAEELPPWPAEWKYRTQFTREEVEARMRDAIAASRRASPSLPDVAMPEQASWRDKLRWSKANTDYHGMIAFTPGQLEHFVNMLIGDWEPKRRAAQPAEGSAQVATFSPTERQYLDWCERHDLPDNLSRDAFDDAVSLHLETPAAVVRAAPADSRDELEEAIRECIRVSEDMMSDNPPSDTKARFAETRNNFHALMDRLFGSGIAAEGADTLQSFAGEVYTAMRCFDGTWGNSSNEMRRATLETKAAKLMKGLAAEGATPAGELVQIGELIEIPDGCDQHPNTIMANWNDQRWNLPAGTVIYARIDGDKHGEQGGGNDTRTGK